MRPPFRILYPAFPMPNPKITYIGAGSSVFAARLITDVVATPGLDAGTFALIDVDAARLDLSRQIAEMLVRSSGKDWEVQTSTDREELLPGTDYLINSIEVAGLACVEPDYEIPLKYGVDQCIGDTIGPGGIFKALRTGPDWLAIVADTQRLAPAAVVMNYTNPMSILTLAADRTTDLSVVGLCHSVQGTSRLLAGFLDVPYEELEWRCAGINHNAWFTKLAHDGQDLYPRLRELAVDPDFYEQEPVRFEAMLHLGAFVTESSGHFSEYVPYLQASRPAREVHPSGLPGRVRLLRPQLALLAGSQRQACSRDAARRRASRDRPGPRIRVVHRGSHRAGQAARDPRQRQQWRPDREPAARLRRGRLPGRWAGPAPVPVRPAAGAAGGPEPLPYGGPRARRPGAAGARPRQGQAGSDARPTDGGGLLPRRDQPAVRRDVGGRAALPRRLRVARLPR